MTWMCLLFAHGPHAVRRQPACALIKTGRNGRFPFDFSGSDRTLFSTSLAERRLLDFLLSLGFYT